MADPDNLHLIARREDSLVLVSYRAYLRTSSDDALRQAAEHARKAVHALIRADELTAFAARALVEQKLPGVRTLITAAADRIATDTAARLGAVWRLLQLPSPSPQWIEAERELAMRLLTTALVSAETDVLKVRERVEVISHRRVANLLMVELAGSEVPWKAALSAEQYKHLSHCYAPRTGAGRAQLCAAFERIEDKERVVSMLALWLDSGARREMLASCLNDALAECVPPVLV